MDGVMTIHWNWEDDDPTDYLTLEDKERLSEEAFIRSAYEKDDSIYGKAEVPMSMSEFNRLSAINRNLKELGYDLENLRGVSRDYPSREVSLSITNLEQAIMWLERAE